MAIPREQVPTAAADSNGKVPPRKTIRACNRLNYSEQCLVIVEDTSTPANSWQPCSQPSLLSRRWGNRPIRPIASSSEAAARSSKNAAYVVLLPCSYLLCPKKQCRTMSTNTNKQHLWGATIDSFQLVTKLCHLVRLRLTYHCACSWRHNCVADLSQLDLVALPFFLVAPQQNET